MRRSDGRHNTFTYTGKYSFFTGTPNQLFDVGANGNTGSANELNSVFGNRGNRWRVNNFGVHRHLYSLKYIASGKVDSGSHFKAKLDVGFLCRNQGVNHFFNMSTGQIVSFEFITVKY